MIKQRTLFTVFLCIVLSFSLFSGNVYAAAGSGKYYVVPTPTLGIFNDLKQRVITVEPTVNLVSLQNGRYYGSSTYSFTETFFLSAYANRTGSLGSFSYSDPLLNGVYSFSFPLSYKIRPFHTDGYNFSPAEYQVFVSFPDLPEGLQITSATHNSYFNSDGTYNLDFWLTGSCFFNQIGITPSVSIKFDFVYSTISTESYLMDFYLYERYVVDLDLFQGMDGGYSYIPFTFVSPNASTDSILGSVNDSINDVNDTIKQEHQEEIDKTNEATSSATSGVGTLTNTLSTWEIITMPFNLVKNFAQAIAGDGSSALTFPSFSLLGQQIWPSYSFDLQTVASRFPVLYNGLHLVSGSLVVSGFVRYLWRKWSLLVGDDMPEGGDSS